MNLLLDTQALLWWKEGSRKLGRLARRAFDRLLVVQARHEGLTIVTSDRAFDNYGVPVIDARA